VCRRKEGIVRSAGQVGCCLRTMSRVGLFKQESKQYGNRVVVQSSTATGGLFNGGLFKRESKQYDNRLFKREDKQYGNRRVVQSSTATGGLFKGGLFKRKSKQYGNRCLTNACTCS